MLRALVIVALTTLVTSAPVSAPCSKLTRESIAHADCLMVAKHNIHKLASSDVSKD